MKTAVSLGLCGIAVTGVILSATMGNPLQQPIGPGYAPLCISTVMLILCIWETVHGLKALKSRRSNRAVVTEAGAKKGLVKILGQNSRWLTAAVLIAAALLIWSIGGYFLGMAACVFAVTSADRRLKFSAALPYALALTFSLWLLFKVALKTSLG